MNARFSHWVERQVGYEALLFSDRRMLHRETARAIEAARLGLRGENAREPDEAHEDPPGIPQPGEQGHSFPEQRRRTRAGAPALHDLAEAQQGACQAPVVLHLTEYARAGFKPWHGCLALPVEREPAPRRKRT